MSKIRSKNTKFEKSFITHLKKSTSEKFRTHDTHIKGKPDIVFDESKVCVFLDSDFWHGWQYPRWKHLLKNDFWRNKIERNRARDKKTTRFLRRKGWKVIRLWEHQINSNVDKCLKRITTSLKKESERKPRK